MEEYDFDLEEHKDLLFWKFYDFVKKLENPELMMGENVPEYKQFCLNYRLLSVAKSEYLTIEKINELLKDGADINYVDRCRDSILHHIVDNSKATLEVIQFLLESGAFPDARNKDNDPPLAYCNQLSVAKLLIQYTVMTKMRQNALVGCFDFNNEYRFFGESETILNLHFCKDVGRYTFYRNYRDSCIAEMKLMKNDLIGKDYTVFDFITQNYRQKDKKVDESTIIEVVSRLINKKYPSCRDIIYATIGFCGGIDLTRLFDVKLYTVNPLAENPSKKVIFLNAECTSEVESNLTAEDTVNLIRAFGQNNLLKIKMCSAKRLREENEPSSVKKLHTSED